MKPQFQVLHDARLNLIHNMTQRFSDGPVPQELRILRTGFNIDHNIKKGTEIFKDMELATHPSPEKGNIHSPVRGVIEDITPRFIIIKVIEDQPTDPKPLTLNEADFESLFAPEKSYEEHTAALKDLGIDAKNIAAPADTLIINALNPEPGIMWAEPLISVHIRTLQIGIILQKRLAKPKRVIMAVPKGTQINLPDIEIAYIDPIYPNSLDPLVIKSITGKEYPDNVSIVSVHALWGLGRVLVTGRPLTETVVTLGSPSHSGNYIIKEGTRILDLLKHANIPLNQGDTIVLGGPLRGDSISLPERGIPKHINGIFLIPSGSVPTLEGTSPCVNCGACVLICPSRISPAMISKYAEFALYDKCEEYHTEACMECGLCGFVCIARRPVLQYIKLAKQKLGLHDIIVQSTTPF